MKTQLKLLSIFLISTCLQTILTEDSTTASNSSNSASSDTSASNAATTTSNEVILTDTSTSETTSSNLNNLKCNAIDSTNLTIGNNATVCIFFLSDGYRMAYNIGVDEYTILSVAGIYNLLSTAQTRSQMVAFSIGNNLTNYPSEYYVNTSPTNQYVVPLFNIVIKVDSGNITDVVWDNDCYDCLVTDYCYNMTTQSLFNASQPVSEKNCKSPVFCTNDATGLNCDPKFYITWFGTDSQGKSMKSANLAMSRFRQYAVGSLYNSAKSALNTTVAKLTDTWSSIKTSADNVIKQFKSS